MLYFRHVSYQAGLSKSHFQSKGVKTESRIWYYEISLKTSNRSQTVKPTYNYIQILQGAFLVFGYLNTGKNTQDSLPPVLTVRERFPKKCTVSNTPFCKSELLYCN